MAASKTYLVPIDFSKGSEVALRHAIRLAREKRSKLILVHVLSTIALYPPEETFFPYQDMIRKDAEEQFKKLVRRAGLKPREFRSLILMAEDTARAIARQAKKARAAMIIMASHGRTGLQRLLLGSVAEKTLRYAECPVLIVKK
jgi:nucleotide-binding universal stress UspA family protein